MSCGVSKVLDFGLISISLNFMRRSRVWVVVPRLDDRTVKLSFIHHSKIVDTISISYIKLISVA